MDTEREEPKFHTWILCFDKKSATWFFSLGIHFAVNHPWLLRTISHISRAFCLSVALVDLAMELMMHVEVNESISICMCSLNFICSAMHFFAASISFQFICLCFFFSFPSCLCP